MVTSGILTELLQGGVAAAAVTAAAGFIVKTWGERRERRSRAREIRSGIYAEVVDNLTNLRHWLGPIGLKRRDEIAFAVGFDLTKKIYLVMSRDTKFYEMLLTETVKMPPQTLVPIVRFYSELSFFHKQVEGLQTERFEQISGPGRSNAIVQMWNAVSTAWQAGHDAATALHRQLFGQEMPREVLEMIRLPEE